MKHSIIAWLCVAVLFLGGCSKDDVPIVTAEYQSALSYGVFEADQLAVLPWSSGRAESTTANAMAETENGYYFVYYGYIYYADKDNLNNWVLMCNKPACAHYENPYCNAATDGGWVLVKDNRLFFSQDSCYTNLLMEKNGVGPTVVSTALDGTDKKIACIVDATIMSTEGSYGQELLGDQWLCSATSIDTNGIKETYFFRVNADGIKEVPVPKGAGGSMYLASELTFLWGDPYFQCNMFSDKKLLRFQGDELVGFEMKYLPDTGGHISDTTLRIFKENKGYFDIDVTTGKQVKVADNRLKDSTGMILAPNCVVESTLFSFNRKNRTEAGAIEVFDGESWRSVQLPEEWQNPGADHWLHVLGITSDSIWIYGRNEEDFYGGWGYPSDLYRIPLDKEELVMEYCFTFPI